jgi:DNA-binding Lrp family transcriptional regulator
MTKNQERDILRILQDNARLSADEIAAMVNGDPEKVKSLIHSWEANGVIIKYTTVLNELKLEDSPTTLRALIEVNVRPEKKTGFDAIASRICKHPNVVDHYLISGSYDFLVIVEGRSLQEISSFVSDKLASIENVRGTATHFILKKYKDHGVIFESEPLPERLAVSP